MISEHPCEINLIGKDTYLSEGPISKPQDLLGFQITMVGQGGTDLQG